MQKLTFNIKMFWSLEAKEDKQSKRPTTAGFSSSKFRSSCLPFVVKQTTLPVFVAPFESNYGWLKFFPWFHRIRDNESLKRSYENRKCSLFNDERETTRAKFWRAKTSIACPDSWNDLKLIRCFCCWFFFTVKFFESCGTTDFRSSFWVELRLTQIFSMVPSNSR
jgi:hypothetical protein